MRHRIANRLLWTILFLALVAGLMAAAAATAIALSPPGGSDPGPYAACVNSKSGAVSFDVLSQEAVHALLQ